MMVPLRMFALPLIVAGSVSFASPDLAAEINPLQLSPHHVTASVADLEKESAWYTRVLGFRVTGRFEDDVNLKVRQMGIPGYRIDLVWKKGSAPGRQALGAAQQGWLHVVFQTSAIDQV
ncbi:MAG: VOC family protein [Caulobacteraceae bacterium]